ncbi:RdgB/HAM1 family non-canonical purine NTP pyrophosphatase [Thermocrinis minervae]|uniref:dITP/XTP pyrophosphatase n=1 Tax=Thermocrinis minervae TaxID=381751 RepID=A0A1M6SV97_9AQUI|nr:RdgB/HAM1 family non-canonical purine NTP pyrophosphatase [Thermocrinis minervae]SHK48654.1 XTP/dITP diphosphohydrolase [Thermocrinis minervae]
MKILVATSNRKKLRELMDILSPYGFELELPEETLEVEETGTTFLENAYLKARAYYQRYRLPTLAEDSGLVVPSLGGYPGIYSSRFHSIDFGGVEHGKDPDRANIKKLLRLMENVEDRRAYYYACVVLYIGDGGVFAEGRCEGAISREEKGSYGFGYDPVFIPEGYNKTMAELPPEEKNRISHRRRALTRLLEVLRWK